VSRILVIDDDENVRFWMELTLSDAGHTVEARGSAKEARAALAERDYEAVFCDINLGDEDGIELVRWMRENGYQGPIVIITAHGSIESAIAAMRAGADDYIQKPLRVDEVTIQVGRLLERGRRHRRLRLYERLDEAQTRGSDVLGESPAWTAALGLAERLARLPLATESSGEGDPGGALRTILLLGETGTGKGALARHIHGCVRRGAKEPDAVPPLVTVNCTALPPTLVEAELFGHERGAFTDAREPREGLFEMANGGTIFLDEIGDMPLELQAKILTVIEDGEFRRVGGNRTKTIRARLVAATNRDLEARVRDGSFRSDLFYRLNAFTIVTPPLRERGTDAVLIAEAALGRFAEEFGRPAMRLGEAARRSILRHAWPGNVRELVNAVQRAAVLAEAEEIEPEDLGLAGLEEPAGGAEPDNGTTNVGFDFSRGRYTMESVERNLLAEALRYTGGNIAQGARLIGMQRTTFRYRLERHGLLEFCKELSKQ